jgi:hypothetical protein
VALPTTEGGSISKIWSRSTSGERTSDLNPGDQILDRCQTSTTTIKWFTQVFLR